MSGNSNEQAKFAALETEFGIAIPEGTSLVQSEFLLGKDAFLWVELKMTGEAVASVTRQIEGRYNRAVEKDIDYRTRAILSRPSFQFSKQDLKAIYYLDDCGIVVCQTEGDTLRVFLTTSSCASGLDEKIYTSFGE